MSRLLKQPSVQEAIAEPEDAIEKAPLVTPERIIANVAAIAFDPDASRTDTIRASELLGRSGALWSDSLPGVGQAPTINVVFPENDKSPEERRLEIAERNAG